MSIALDKEKIKANFNNASRSYDKVASIQEQCAASLVGLLNRTMPTFVPTSILDVGTGTGCLAECLLKMFPNSHYTLNDLAPNMLEIAKAKFSQKQHCNFQLDDAETAQFAHHHLIASNLALQWVNNLTNTVQKLAGLTDVLLFSCLLDGTFAEWSMILEQQNIPTQTKKYPNLMEIEKILTTTRSPHTFKIEEASFQLTFMNVRDFMIYLRHLGAGLGNGSLSLAQLCQLMKYDHNLTITYKVCFVLLVHKKS